MELQNIIPSNTSYGVLWRSKQNPHDWFCHAGWSENLTEMIEPYKEIVGSPDCIQACIVMRTETIQPLQMSEVVMESPNESVAIIEESEDPKNTN